MLDYVSNLLKRLTMMKDYLKILPLLALPLYAQDDLSSLLESYVHESELSKITKKEEAGVIDIYTRHDLEMMQAKTFGDVLKVVPGFHYTRTYHNLTFLQKPSMVALQLSGIHLYVNDHDLSSNSFGSSFLIWGELPIEYIDHIEVYKGSASIEFGNETSTVIVKMYTKSPQREEGSKLRFVTDNYGSYNADGYIASKEENFSYFAYANINGIKRKEYYNEYEDKEYTFKSDHSGHNLYANFNYKEWILELGSYVKKSDNFLGVGLHRTPTDGDLDTSQDYLHLTKKFNYDIKLQLSYDRISYDRTYIDPNGIMLANAPLVTDYRVGFYDDIYSAILEKKVTYDKHVLLFGGFVKKKDFKEYGYFENIEANYIYRNSFVNTQKFYSFYAEYSYDYDPSTRFLASVKEDFITYDKIVASKSEISGKLGMVKYLGDLQIKTFLTKTYAPVAFYQLYNPDNIPYKTNKELENMHILIESLSLVYRKQKHKFKFVFAENQVRDAIFYNKDSVDGYNNMDKIMHYDYVELEYEYNFDLNNKFTTTFFYGNTSNDTILSPRYTTLVKLFSQYKKFDFYNELAYKSSYTYAGLDIGRSYDFTSAIKYHYSKDLSLGVRGENIFAKGYEQAYTGLDYAIDVVDPKVWFNLEYLF